MQTEDLKPNILYVDDEQDNILVFKSSFRRNYHIQTANSATEAKEILQKHAFDVIISDQRMPEITGVQFLQSLPDEPGVFRMILTGYSDMEAIIQAINSGMVHKYITKPWVKTELQEVIDSGIALAGEKRKFVHLKTKSDKGSNNSTSDIVSNKTLKKEYHVNTTDEQQQELEELRKRLDASDKHVKLLSEIGQEIISNITVDGIIESTYANVNTLMDANSFGIAVYNSHEDRLEFNCWIEKGAKLPFASVSLSEKDRPAIQCFRNREEVILNDFQMKAITGEATKSLIYLPLLIKDVPIGVITTQSFSKNAYNQYHVNILRNLAIYVATAIENAKSYQLIEQQKAEIEQKNIELENKVEQRTIQLQQKNEEVEKQRDKLESTYHNIKLLSDIGQQITATLSLQKIIETVYENINSLMDATVFLIGIYEEGNRKIDIYGMEKGRKLPEFSLETNEINWPAIWCFNNQREFIINDYQQEYNKYIKSIPKPKSGEQPESMIYLPLTISEDKVGVISVQSFRKHVYSHYHIDILRSLGSYITIALQNAGSYHKMTHAFEELKQAQTKLVESEKMASLGVLTAGVAHEINNPVNFISAGIESLTENYEEFKELVHAFLEYNGQQPDPEKWKRIELLQQKLSPLDMMEEMDELLASVKNGANRTAEIVKGLRNFTRLDEHDRKLFNVEEGLDSTLVILNNHLKNRVDVIKYYGKVPDLVGLPGQLNQVFMNLIYNAADAIPEKGKIEIKTWVEDESIKISITDNGKGMSEEVRSRIFEPFYTTKDVGKGTGLGLSISFGIIEKHNGQIEVVSKEGFGTTFTITLPLNS